MATATDMSGMDSLDSETTRAYDADGQRVRKETREMRVTAEVQVQPITGVHAVPGDGYTELDPDLLELAESDERTKSVPPPLPPRADTTPPPPPAMVRSTSHQERDARLDDAVLAVSLLQAGDEQLLLGKVLRSIGDEPAYALVAERSCRFGIPHRAALMLQFVEMTVREMPALRERTLAAFEKARSDAAVAASSQGAAEQAREEQLAAEHACRVTFDALAALTRSAA